MRSRSRGFQLASLLGDHMRPEERFYTGNRGWGGGGGGTTNFTATRPGGLDSESTTMLAAPNMYLICLKLLMLE